MERVCIVTGASSQIGTWLVPMLQEDGWLIHAVSRGMKEQTQYGSNVVWHSIDLSQNQSSLSDFSATTLFHTSRIWLLPPIIESIAKAGVRRIIAFSSTSRLTKERSDDVNDRTLSRLLAQSEDDSFARCKKLNIDLTILRPTITYGGKLDNRSVGDIALIIKRLGFFPLVGRAAGLRQPVHARSLAQAALSAAAGQASAGKSYNLGGGEVLPYSAFVERIFAAMGRKPRTIRIPMAVFRVAIASARLHPRFRHLTTGIADRMNKDMIFDLEPACHDFGYAPEPFNPDLAT